MSTFNEVLKAARSLSADDRLRLMDSLRDDVAPQNWPLPSSEWIEKAQRRSDDYDQGAMPAASRSEVRQRARRKAGLDG